MGGGGGGQPNLGNACILGASVPGTPPLPWSQVLHTLQFCCSVVTKRRVWCAEAGFEQEIIGCLVAESVGVLTPGPKVRVLDWLRRQLGLEFLGSCHDWASQGSKG